MDVLSLPMKQPNDASAATIGEYLKALLHELWTEGEGFSGKRPFGNSGWERDLYRAVVAGGAADGKIDSDGDVIDIDEDGANEAIRGAIDALGGPASAPVDYVRPQAISIALQAAGGGPKQIEALIADADKVVTWLRADAA